MHYDLQHRSAEAPDVARRLVGLPSDARISASNTGASIEVAGAGTFDCTPLSREVVADVYDRLVAALLKRKLITITKTRLEVETIPVAREPDLQVIEGSLGARVLAADGPIADITASRVHLLAEQASGAPRRAGNSIIGNFLQIDARWHYAARHIRTAARSQLAEARRRAEIVRGLPADLAPAQASLMRKTSRRLRNHRNIAYGHVVRLLGPDSLRIRLEPLARSGTTSNLTSRSLADRVYSPARA